MQNLDYNLVECQALVLAPTRELAQQIEKVRGEGQLEWCCPEVGRACCAALTLLRLQCCCGLGAQQQPVAAAGGKQEQGPAGCTQHCSRERIPVGTQGQGSAQRCGMPAAVCSQHARQASPTW